MTAIKFIIEFLMDVLETIVFIGTLFIVVYLYILQPNQVKGESMVPTFDDGDYIFTSKVTYKLRQPHRGDVVVFHSPRNPDIEYIKRIIGLPGDKVQITDGTVSVNGTVIEENYIAATTNLWPGGFVENGQVYTVNEGDVFVMGDNRPRSSDSREFGPVPFESVVGQVFYRYFPTSQMGQIKNPFKPELQSMITPAQRDSLSHASPRCYPV